MSLVWNGPLRRLLLKESALLPAASAFAVKLAGAGLAFAQTFFVSRVLGIADAGSFFSLLSINMILCALGRLGLGYVVPRAVAEHAVAGDWRGIASVVQTAAIWTLVSSSLVTVAFLYVGTATGLLPDHIRSQGPNLVLFQLAVPIYSTASILAETLKGLSRPVLFALYENVIIKFCTVVFVVLLGGSTGLKGASFGFLAANAVALAYVLSVLVSVTKRRVFGPRDGWRFDRLLRSVGAFSVYSFGTGAIQWLYPLIVGTAQSPQAVAIYFAAARTAAVLDLITISICTVVLPISVRAASERGARFALVQVRRQAGIAAVALVAAGAPIVAFAPFIMSLYGPGFETGWPVLVVFSIGQVVAGILLVFVQTAIALHRERQMAYATLLWSTVGAFAVYQSALSFGLTGAAIASTATVVLVNLTVILDTLRRAGRAGDD